MRLVEFQIAILSDGTLQKSRHGVETQGVSPVMAGADPGIVISWGGMKNWSAQLKSESWSSTAKIQRKLSDGGPWVDYATLTATNAATDGTPTTHITTAGVFFETTGQSFLLVPKIRVVCTVHNGVEVGIVYFMAHEEVN